ncbi:butyrate kinase [Dethiobacter alkaliphilus]|uniref:Probable butyrate kinase n=1 Tax=Dethiobacter alkaliphilus AHT 1 TaxID=555088 RepID=C0GHW9_DETAL|nr:butyrate kinase [Dethiobacter alkaliphilus]EEG77043.1 butyrate kinase [Dethiobacter alkaliphilus AHT 1]
MEKVLAINPGSTSTKIGLFDGEHCVLQEAIRHPREELESFSAVMDQVEYRCGAITYFLKEHGVALESLAAIVVRGGLLRPVSGGVWLVDEQMRDDLLRCRFGAHASNLGAVMAFPWGQKLGIPVYTVDPVTVDEFAPLARYSGLKEIRRQSMSHALNTKAVARRCAGRLGKGYGDVNLVIAHLGSGISVSAHQRGRMIDVNNANNEGPFSLERTGTLPALALIDMCFNGEKSREEMRELVTAKGGIYSYLQTKDFKEVTERAAAGDSEAREVMEAMAYQVGKEIGAMAAVLHGDVDAVALTGGMAYSEILVKMIEARVGFLGRVEVFAGEEELTALAEGALRALRGEEKPRIYGRD